MTTNILDYLEQTAQRLPEKTALADDKQNLTFSHWVQQAESIGTAITQATNNTIHRAVLVFVDRRIESLVGAMGVVESGNFYVPIDCKMPFERVRLIADVCKPIAAVAITEADLKTLDQIAFDGPRFLYDEVKEHEADKKVLAAIRAQIIDLDPVYSIFTSGSTGVPKGVVISHRGMMDFADFLVERFGIADEDAVANQAPFYFDCSVKDIGICLRSGATLNIIPKKCFAFPKLLVDFLNERKVTCLFWATSAVILVANTGILDEKKPLYLKHVSFGGEAMPAKQLNNWKRNLPDVQYINVYGPTEVTVDCTYYVVDREFTDGEYVPIGQNIPNKQVILLNDEDKLAAVGEVGEICCRGTGVAMGYYNNREKTDSVFVQNPLHDLYNDIIYRTGDLGRWNEKGELEFVSRKDFQVKHKGNRIELGEIEVAVNAIEAVTNAACIFDYENDKLVLYYTTVDGQPMDIINLVKERIPVYMFPEVVNHLTQMPYNLNGKIDRIELKKRYDNGEKFHQRK
jgi:amino acid adenylation domain-containing protein